MRTTLILTALLVAAAGELAAGSNAKRLQGKPPCSATVTANCIKATDGDGNFAITSTLLVPLTVTTGAGGQTIAVVSAFHFNNTAGNIAYTLPAITAATVSARYCFRNSATRTGTITLTAPESTTIDNDGTATAEAGSVASAGALGDNACVIAVSTTQYVLYKGLGTWN